MLNASTNFEGKDISQDILKTINDTIEARLEEQPYFVFDEIKVANFKRKSKSIFITNYEYGAHKKTQLYLNKDYFWGKSLNDLNSTCEKCFNDNWWKSKNVSDLVNHEIMHSKINYGNSIEKAEALYERLSEDSRVKGFCRLVDSDGGEFLNEVYVALNNREKSQQNI